jgi:hypothetical protein
MNKHQPGFKPSQLYDWHSEPKEERSSSFFEQSGYANSGYQPMPARKKRVRQANSLIVAIVIAVAFGLLGLFGLMRVLQS